MVCEFQKLIYPPSAGMVEVGSYMVALYRPCEKVMDSSGRAVREIKAVGYCLPVAANLRYDMTRALSPICPPARSRELVRSWQNGYLTPLAWRRLTYWIRSRNGYWKSGGSAVQSWKR